MAKTFISRDSKEDIVLVIELELTLLDEVLEEGYPTFIGLKE